MPLGSTRITGAEAFAAAQTVRAALLELAVPLRTPPRAAAGDPLCNPPLWELGHAVWFQEKWCLRRRLDADPNASPLLNPLRPGHDPWSDWRYDSARIPHAARWAVPLPDWDEMLAYAAATLAALGRKIAEGWPGDDPDLPHFVELSVLHEAMHAESWLMQCQHLGHAPPRPPRYPALSAASPIEHPGGPVVLGQTDAAAFAFDNERPAMVVSLPPFSIDAVPVSAGEFAEFIAAGGYAEPAWWTSAGWAWRCQTGARQPHHWRQDGGQWQQQVFGDWQPLAPDEAVRHVCAHEAEAFAAWRGRRLPRAAEWHAASALPAFRTGGVWEWTGSDFRPYPGFVAGAYADYALPSFHSHRELRGRDPLLPTSRHARAGFRNFYLPTRHDPFVGFRTAA